MPKIASREVEESTPEKLRPYEFHGLDLSWKNGDTHAVASECPFCGRSGKFNIVIATGQWRCVVCEEGNDKGGGNIYILLRKIWEMSFDQTTPTDYRELAKNRTLEDSETPMRWELAKSILTGEWLVPGYGLDGTIKTLYRYSSNGSRKALLATPTLGHYMTGLNLFDKKKKTVMMCEGVWDAMPLWEQLGKCKMTENGLALTANPDASLLSTANVLSFPGATTFKEQWCELFKGKEVILMAQNDHERITKHPKTGKRIVAKPASFHGMKKIAELLTKSSTPPELIKILWWGDKGYDESFKHGFDVRDVFASVGK